tara:strand:- start:1445 stop:1867 length:423 start_codon:yes stop_codon:yes gene_type:complete
MAKLVCVYGPPCAGKSTYANKIRRPGDLVVERDQLHSAISGLESHNHTKHGMAVTNAAVRGILKELKHVETPQQIIFVTGGSTKQRRQPFLDAGAEMKLIYADRATCQKRASLERPEQWTDYVNKWHDAFNADIGRRLSS